MSFRHVDVTILGRIDDVRGLPARRPNPLGLNELSLSEPCELTVHLPSGKMLSLRTRPILIISCPILTDAVTSVRAPPEEKKGSLADKAREIEDLLAQWQVVPGQRMRDQLAEWKKRDDIGSDHFRGVVVTERIRTDLDEQTELTFEVSTLTPGWNLMVEIDAKPEGWAKARREARDRVARSAVTTKSTTIPAVKPETKRRGENL